MSSIKKRLLALSSIAAVASANLVIYGPADLKAKFEYLGKAILELTLSRRL